MWIDKTFGTDTALTNDWRFHNYKLTITAPDGTVTIKTFETVIDTTSSQSYSFAPDQVGTYQLKFEFPGQDYNTYSHNPNSAFVNDTYLPSSATGTLTVQQDLCNTFRTILFQLNTGTDQSTVKTPTGSQSHQTGSVAVQHNLQTGDAISPTGLVLKQTT